MRPPNKAGTLTVLRADREQLIEPKIAQHEGRIVTLVGDDIFGDVNVAVHTSKLLPKPGHLHIARS